MYLVDEHDRAVIGLDLLDDLLQPLLEIAAIAGAGEQHTHVEREDGGVLQNVRHVAVDDALGQTFGNRRLADAGIADEQRVVLLPAAQDLNRALDFLVAPDQRVDLAVFGLEVEVDAVGFQRLVLLAALPFGLGLLVLGPAPACGFSLAPARLAMPWEM